MTSLIFTPLIHALGLQQNAIELSLKPERGDIWIGSNINMNLRVTNLDPNNELTVNEIRLFLPSGWAFDTTIGFKPSLPIIIPSNSSDIIQFTLLVPRSDTDGNNFTITGRINALRTDVNGTVTNYIDTFSTDVVTKTKPPEVLREIDWNAVWLLFLVYAIPGAAIERIVELAKWRVPWRVPSYFLRKDAEILAYKDEIKRQEARQTDDVKPEVIVGEKPKTSIPLSATGKAIRDFQLEISQREMGIKVYTYLVSFIFSLIIAVPFVVYFNLGLLQTVLKLEDQNWTQIADILMTAVIMAFITKPTHDVITLIERIRNVQVPPK
jgi:hypothetical protein